MASEIRVNKINSRTGVGTITLSPTGVDFTGIATVATLKATTGIVTTLTVTGTTTLNGNLDLQDDDKILIGTGDDLEIYHDGSNSYIDDTGTGRLNIRGNTGVSLRNYSDNEQFINCYTNGTVELFYDNNKKFETTSAGVTITGTATATEGLVLDGQTGSGKGLRLDLAGSGDYIIQETTTDDVVQFGGTGASNFFVHNISSGNIGIATDSPNHRLTLHNGGTGTFDALNITSGLTNSVGLQFGIDSSSNVFFWHTANGAIKFATNNVERMRVTNNGITFNGDTAAANALDDYEEGNWTPAMNSGGWTGFTVNTAKYVKIGGQVFVQCYVSALTGSSSGNVLKLSGLPYLPISNGYTVGSVDFGEGGVKGAYCRTESDTNQISFLYPSENNSTARVTLKGNQIGDAYIILGLTYYTSS